MTAIEKWVTDLTRVLIGDAPADLYEAIVHGTLVTPHVDDLGRRIACGLIQARALECRHLAGEIMINGGAHSQALMHMVKALGDRSHKLEAIAMLLAQPGVWPIQEEDEAPPAAGPGLVVVKH